MELWTRRCWTTRRHPFTIDTRKVQINTRSHRWRAELKVDVSAKSSLAAAPLQFKDKGKVLHLARSSSFLRALEACSTSIP